MAVQVGFPDNLRQSRSPGVAVMSLVYSALNYVISWLPIINLTIV